MILEVKKSKLDGRVAVPGSKSHTIRAAAAALLASGKSILHSPLISADTVSTLNAAEALGAAVLRVDDRWEITGTAGRLTDPGRVVDMGNSGTGLRMLSALCANCGFPVTFDGDASLRTRPMKNLAAALRSLGAEVSADFCPLTIRGPLTGGRAEVEAVSSQFLSALLFALPLAPDDSELTVTLLNEAPYVGITLDWLKRCGIRVNAAADYRRFEVPGRQKYLAFDAAIPADFSTACFPLGAAMTTGSKIIIDNLDFNDPQGDKLVFDHFAAMGAEIERGAGGTAVSRGRNFIGRDIDLNSTPDALPVMAACACFASGVTRLLNVPQARIKETDRIACMTAELRKMGANVEELPDGMVITGGALHGAELDSHDDHRIAMALAVAAMGAGGAPSTIRHAEAIAVTYPGFVNDFVRLGAAMRPAVGAC
ncbi:MAG: 3-phosphoshikimate 1-carboxyvinyltransferase [Victivallaceae bacterium]|nr:3-phosphoshikimate 1-carboxyvinyltransferase [Victivallaceae bacterium]